MNEPMSHDQARRLAAVRLDQPLPAGDEADLETHLAGCADCRAVAAGYEADRLALRAMAPIEPPRDLWARTSAALEREHARHPRSLARGPRRWGPVAVLGGGVAVVLVLAIVGPGLFARTSPTPGPIAIASGNAHPAPSSGPTVTPLVVPSSEVTWVVTKGSGGLAIVTAKVDKVCQTGDEPDCAPLAGISRSLADLPTVPSSVVLSPSNASQAVAIGPSSNKLGATLFVMAVPTAPAPAATPSAVPSAAGSGGPGQSPVPSPSQGAPASAASGTPSPSASSSQAASSVPSFGAASPSPAIGTPPVGSPAPTAAATLAILSNVTLVGDGAAYSPDGQWFAFSARPAGTTIGPDIYLWRAGWPVAQPTTTDHGSIFSGWVDDQILASRAVPVLADASPVPGGSSPAVTSPAANPSASPVASAAPPQATPPTGPTRSPGAASTALPEGSPVASPSAAVLLATPAAYLLDPASGVATRIVGLDGWRPVVDPSGRWVAYWAGTLTFDPASGMWQPFQGGLQVASWPVVSTAVDGPTGAAAAHPVPLDVGADWDLRWDRQGQHLGVWIADPNNPGLGSLSLVTIDPASGLTSSAPPILLNMTPALRGFALRDGQLVWATPPGQDGKGSQPSNAGRGKTSGGVW